MAINCLPHPQYPPTFPCECDACGKRHARPDHSPAGGVMGVRPAPRRRALVSVAALAASALAVASCALIPAAAAAVPAGDAAIIGRRLEATRRLEAAAGGNVFEDGHEDHDHGDQNQISVEAAIVAVAAEEAHDDHDGHDHGGTTAAEEDGHEGHDHGDGGDNDHAGHDHGDDDHAGHDHGDGELVSSANETTSENLPWGPVIGASLLVNLATLSGVLIVAMIAIQRGLLKRQGKDASDAAVGHGTVFDVCIPAFAVGALISTAVFLIFPEALHLIEGGHGEGGDSHDGHDHRYLQEDAHAGHDDSSEGQNAAKFGCAILGGFLLPMVFSIFFHDPDHVDNHTSPPADADRCESCLERDAETGVPVGGPPGTIVQKMEDSAKSSVEDFREEEQAIASTQESAPPVSEKTVNKQLMASILLGDGFHNFADGIFIGAAFKSCSTGTAVSIVLVTLFHEVAQELADFIVLTRFAGLSVFKACVLNFLSGLTVCLGGIVFLAANPSDEATGIVLAMAGGVYFNIAGCETVPRIEGAVKSRLDRVWTLLWVIIGTIPIGLILLNHQHC